jgi:hypothetical protein
MVHTWLSFVDAPARHQQAQLRAVQLLQGGDPAPLAATTTTSEASAKTQSLPIKIVQALLPLLLVLLAFLVKTYADRPQAAPSP